MSVARVIEGAERIRDDAAAMPTRPQLVLLRFSWLGRLRRSKPVVLDVNTTDEKLAQVIDGAERIRADADEVLRAAYALVDDRMRTPEGEPTPHDAASDEAGAGT